jgi:CcmD family protein
MARTKHWLALMLLIFGLAAPAFAQPQQPPQPPPQQPRAAQDEFVPVNELPESEKLPAAPFLITAYTIVWVVLLVYVWSLWRRLSAVEQELKQAVQTAAQANR